MLMQKPKSTVADNNPFFYFRLDSLVCVYFGVLGKSFRSISKNINGNSISSRILWPSIFFFFYLRSFGLGVWLKLLLINYFNNSNEARARSHVWHICNLLDAKLTAFTLFFFHLFRLSFTFMVHLCCVVGRPHSIYLFLCVFCHLDELMFAISLAATVCSNEMIASFAATALDRFGIKPNHTERDNIDEASICGQHFYSKYSAHLWVNDRK